MNRIAALDYDVVSLTQALIREGGMSGEEEGVANIVKDAMQMLEYDEVHTDHLGNVVGLVGPPDMPVRLMFDGHMDVVPATGSWSRDPFSGDLRDGLVHGRGSTDMKGPLAAAICGVAKAAQTQRLNTRVAVSASVMEEVIEGAALAKVLDTYAPEMVVICEPSNLRLKTAQRGCIELLVHVQGKPAHAAFPNRGTNAIVLASRAVTALLKLDLPIDPVLGQMVLVPTDIISTPYPSISALPSQVTLRYDRRTGVGETAMSILAEMNKILKTVDPEAFEIEISENDYKTYTDRSIRVARNLPAWRTDNTADLVTAARACLAAEGLCTDIGYYDFCTNGSESAGRRGLPTIGFGPGLEQHAHIIDEAIEVAALQQAERVYSALALKFAI